MTGPGYAYTPWMKENAPDISRRGLYWGSHNRAAGAYTFTTFGDHHALPRAALPDLFFSLVNPFRGLEGTGAAASGRGLVWAYSPTILSDIARVLVAIDGGARSGDGIAAASDVAGPTLASILTFLERLGYVQQGSEGYSLRVAVLKADAGPAAARVVALVREAIDVWHQDRADDAARDLAGLTALRQGVPYKVLYSEIWHYVFGYANLHLSERGLITDPYAPSAPFRGFVPVLWDTGIDASG